MKAQRLIDNEWMKRHDPNSAVEEVSDNSKMGIVIARGSSQVLGTILQAYFPDPLSDNPCTFSRE